MHIPYLVIHNFVEYILYVLCITQHLCMYFYILYFVL